MGTLSLSSVNSMKDLSMPSMLNTVPVRSKGMGEVMASRLTPFASATDVSVLPVEGKQAKSSRQNRRNVFIEVAQIIPIAFPRRQDARYYKFLYVVLRVGM